MTALGAVFFCSIQTYPFLFIRSKHLGHYCLKTNILQRAVTFNGKEWIETHGYDSYDYHARTYYPAIMRFTSIDLLAEKSPGWTPYRAFFNNPLIYIDPDGALGDWVESADGEIYWDENATSQEATKAGEAYLGKNVLVGTHNRDASGNEAINTAKFDLYLESDKIGPSATIMGNTVPADINKYGTVA